MRYRNYISYAFIILIVIICACVPEMPSSDQDPHQSGPGDELTTVIGPDVHGSASTLDPELIYDTGTPADDENTVDPPEYEPDLEYPEYTDLKPYAPEMISVVISSETKTNFGPCGCQSGKWGGMPRRGTLFTQLEQNIDWPLIFVDTGDTVLGNNNPLELKKDDYIFQAYEVLGYDLMSIGTYDLRLGIDSLRSIQQQYNLPFTSANIFPQDARDPWVIETQYVPESFEDIRNIADEPVFQPYRIVEPEEAPGFRIGLMSVLIGDAGMINPLREEVSFEHYYDSIRRYVDILRNEENVDVVILVNTAGVYDHVNTDMMFHGVDVVIGGNVSIDRSPNAFINPLNPLYNPQIESAEGGAGEFAEIDLPIMLAKAPNRGRIIYKLDLMFDDYGRINDYYLETFQVDDTLDDDPRLAEIAAGYDEDIHGPELAERALARFMGSQGCEECHPGYIEAWADHPHFTSQATILESDEPDNRECVRCHAIGYNSEPRLVPYNLVPRELSVVGCEGCHPYGRNHITVHNPPPDMPETMRQQSLLNDPVTYAMNASYCNRCHTTEWSPGFDYQQETALARSICQNVE